MVKLGPMEEESNESLAEKVFGWGCTISLIGPALVGGLIDSPGITIAVVVTLYLLVKWSESDGEKRKEEAVNRMMARAKHQRLIKVLTGRT